MLRFANWYESRLGRNDGNPLYVQACMKRMQFYGDLVAGRPANGQLASWFTDKRMDPRAEAAAKALWDKHHETLEIDHLYPTGEVQAFGTYDANLWVDWGEDGLTGVLPYTPMGCPKPMIYWASDTHIKGNGIDSYDYRLSMAKKADIVFVAQKAAVERMKADGVPDPIWLPHAVEPLAYPRFDLATKKHDVCFIGHVSSKNREEALDQLFREFPNFDYGQALFNDAAARIANSKIGFNISMTDDVNMRTFEVMATGTMLLTNWIPTIEELFKDGEHLVLYRSPEEMIEKVNYYLKHDDERERIAQAGYEEVIAKHTIQARIDVMINEFLKLKTTQEVKQHAGV